MKILEIILIIGIILIIFYFFNKRELFSIENVLDQNTNYDLLYNPKYDPDGTSNSSQLNLSNNLSNNLDYKSNRKLDLPSNLDYDPKYDAPNNQTAIDFPMNNNPIELKVTPRRETPQPDIPDIPPMTKPIITFPVSETQLNKIPFNTPGMNTPGMNTPSMLPNKIRAIFKLNLDFSKYINIYNIDYPNYINNNVNLFITNLTNELTTLLNIPNNSIKIIQLHPGSIYVIFYLFNTINNSPIDLYNSLSSSLPSLANSKYTIINKIDTTYGIKIQNDIELDMSYSQLVPKINTILDDLIQNNTTFALYTYVTKKTIPESSTKTPPVKMYLTVSMSGSRYTPCNMDNGMIKFSDHLSIGGVYYLSKQKRRFPKNKTPYKYIDFKKIIIDNVSGSQYIESTFYNLVLHNNNYSVTHCQKNCDTHNINGLCAQEIYDDHKLSYNVANNEDGTIRKDIYHIKNLMKLKIENDGSVTPYFITMDPVERIYYITNKYSTLEKPNDYMNLVHIPTYEDNKAIYNVPVYNTPLGKEPYYTNEKKDIKDMLSYYSESQISDYQNGTPLLITDTLVTENDAYHSFAYNFHIEILTPDQINSIPKSN
jgi:hypothetical protein